MSAEGNLYNPAIFSGQFPPVWEIAQEYLNICKNIPTSLHMIRPHLFKIFRPCLHMHTDLRKQLGMAKTIDQFEAVVRVLRQRLEESAKSTSDEVTTDENGMRILSHWLCQPYFRPPMPANAEKTVTGDEENTASPKKPRKPRKVKEGLCSHCNNCASIKCSFQSCKLCCREHENCQHCEAHRYKNLPKTSESSQTAYKEIQALAVSAV
ncbi:tRNA dihydrouridine synthase [Basidiobolus ranarum]|uniref:tRNA dihydrouridine synthase n=1 Tax=Basidiobolus ranarum TaxID=34480 RepID=A0ABR2VS87_9FUNG